MKLLRACFAAFLLTLALAPSAHAGVAIILHLDGVTGQTPFQGYENDILINEVSFSAEQVAAQSSAIQNGGTQVAGNSRPLFTPITLSKSADKASAMLFLDSLTAKSILTAKISFVTPTDGAPIVFFSVTLGGVFISKFGVAASVGDVNTQEQIVLNYTKILITYTGPTGAPVTTGFDLVRNVPISTIPGTLAN